MPGMVMMMTTTLTMTKQDLFAGGEKSGLAVQNPEDLKKRIVTRAKQYVTVPHEIATPKANATIPQKYATTWGDEPRVRHPALLELHVHLEETTPSRVVEDPRPTSSTSSAGREHPLWSDGFSVDDGPFTVPTTHETQPSWR
jgi:UBX domain-containing protein 1